MKPYLADAHADSLMWNRDLNQLSNKGHVDFPRLVKAGVRLQCFTVVTQGFPFVGGFPLFAAVQWHPERLSDKPEHLALFKLLVTKASENR